MCMLCVDILKDKLRLDDAVRNLGEVTDPKHWDEVRDLIERVYITGTVLAEEDLGDGRGYD